MQYRNESMSENEIIHFVNRFKELPKKTGLQNMEKLYHDIEPSVD